VKEQKIADGAEAAANHGRAVTAVAPIAGAAAKKIAPIAEVMGIALVLLVFLICRNF